MHYVTVPSRWPFPSIVQLPHLASGISRAGKFWNCIYPWVNFRVFWAELIVKSCSALQCLIAITQPRRFSTVWYFAYAKLIFSSSRSNNNNDNNDHFTFSFLANVNSSSSRSLYVVVRPSIVWPVIVCARIYVRVYCTL